MRYLLPVVFLLHAITPALARAQQEVVQVTAENVRLRATASIEASILSTVPKGTKLTVLGREGGWLQVRYGEKSGFVRASLVSTVAGAPVPVPAPPPAVPPTQPPIRRDNPPPNPPPAPLPREARPEPVGPFKEGANFIGPSVSLATYGSTAAIGGNFERAVKDRFGVGAAAEYYSYSCYAEDCSFRIIILAGTGAYHFETKNEKLDPFVGATVGYTILSCSVSGISCSDTFGHALLVIGGFGGLRYFLKNNLALVGRAGYGVGYLSVGVDFKF